MDTTVVDISPTLDYDYHTENNNILKSNGQLKTYSNLFQKVSYSGIGGIGIIGNVFVIIVIANTPAMKKRVTNCFLVNQSVIDALSSFLLIVDAFVLTNEYGYTGNLGLLRCVIIDSSYSLWSLLMASTYNLLLISLERYFSVVHAILHKKYFRKKVAVCALCVSWIIGLAYNISTPVLAKVKEGKCTFFNFKTEGDGVKLGLASFLFQFAIPLVIMGFCYIRMVIVLNYNNTTRNESNTRIKSNIIKMLAIVSGTFVLCWSWNSVYFLLINIGYDLRFDGWFYFFSVTAVNINCIANPFIYAFKYTQFQRGVKRMFCARHVGPEAPSLTTQTEM